jgi:hypothetical protein
VSEDAAAAARRIVAEVLAQAGIEEDDSSRPSDPTSPRDEATSGPPRGHATPSSAAAEQPGQRAVGRAVEVRAGAVEGRAGRAGGDQSDAVSRGDAGDVQWDDDPGVVARRIVEQVLGSASGPSTQRTDEGAPTPPVAESPDPGTAAAADGPSKEAQPSREGAAPGVPAPAVEARVGQVPAEGLPAAGAETADVDVVAEVPDDSLSAADIVRRIVAEVTSASDAAPISPPSTERDDDSPPSSDRPDDSPPSSDRPDASAASAKRPDNAPPAPVVERRGDEAHEDRPVPAEQQEVEETDDDEGPPPPPRGEPTRELALDEPTETEPTREVPAGRDALDSEPTREVRLRPDADTTHDAPPRGGPLESEPTREVRLRPDGNDPEPTREVPVRRDDAGDEGGRAQAGTTSGTDDEDQQETLWPEARDRGGRATAIEAAAPGPHRAEAGISLLDREAETEAADEDDGGFEAVVPQPATVGSHWEPLVAPPPEVPGEAQAQPHTLRWLLISVLGAVALAVLLPLTVAALRSLVSLG